VTGGGQINGGYSLEFAYKGKPAEEDAIAVQNFKLTSGVSEIWVRFLLRVPNNYYHRDAPGSDNNKFLKISTNPQVSSQEGVNVLWEYNHDGGGGSTLAWHWTIPGIDNHHSPHSQKTYVFGPSEKGTVQEFVFRLKMASSAAANDGIIQAWHRRSGDSQLRKIHDLQDAPLYPGSSWPTQTQFVAGYILGWANSSFASDTTFYLDDVRVASSSLVGSDSAPQVAPPKPPTDVSASN
jgi:hypothetical protein